MAEWIYPKHSRSHIKRIGVILRNSDVPFSETEAIGVLNNWKSAHELPLHYITKTIKKYTKDVSKKNTIVQRIKRTESILLKLDQQPKLDLARMQDIVGFRVVFRDDDNQKNLECIKKLILKIRSSKMRSTVTRITDYIEEPRDSGYRSVHAIFKYNSTMYQKHNSMQVELQIRTKMQHIWATAVETVGMFEQSNLKQGLGDENWLEFFRQMSHLMAIEEGTIKVSTEKQNELCTELHELSNKINAALTLSSIAIQQAILHEAFKDILEKSKSSVGYMLLKLDLSPLFQGASEPTIEIMNFADDSETKATEQYGIWEIEAHENQMRYVLLAKSENLMNLRRGFPNYFADLRKFIDLHNKYCSSE